MIIRMEGAPHQYHEDRVAEKYEFIKSQQFQCTNTDHFASLMDLCYLKNAELEPKFQKYKGRVVRRSYCKR